MSLKEQIDSDGYSFVEAALNKHDSKNRFKHIGPIDNLEGFRSIQTLSPRLKKDSVPNSYSGNFGVDEFPLHSDLAHWITPPRYFALHCVTGSENVATNLLDTHKLKAQIGKLKLQRTLVKPRRPIRGEYALLALLSTDYSSNLEIFRWDTLFLKPATKFSKEILLEVKEAIERMELKKFTLKNQGDLLIVDNWRMIHGRSVIDSNSSKREIERAYIQRIE